MDLIFSFSVVLLAAFIVGIVMGLVGSGGAIITTPALVYILGHAPATAISESLAIVCILGTILAIHSMIVKRVSYSILGRFLPAGVLGVLVSSYFSQFLLPQIQLGLLGLITLSSYRSTGSLHREVVSNTPVSTQAFRAGLFSGAMTGLTGVSGGAVLVPALFNIGLKASAAVGTASIIIVINCGAAFLKRSYLFGANEEPINLGTIALFSVVGALGLFTAAKLHPRLHEASIRLWFSRGLLFLGLVLVWQALTVR